MELLFINSGSVFEATRYTTPCEISRSTISNYLAVLEATSAVYVVRPFSIHRSTEIVLAPKGYAFDTGFICYYRGWQDLRQEDLGSLWEHYVLNEILARTQSRDIRYWRDKRGHEIDFVLVRRGKLPMAIECKWSSTNFASQNLRAFRRQYPEGENWVIVQDVQRTFAKEDNSLKIEFLDFAEFVRRLKRL